MSSRRGHSYGTLLADIAARRLEGLPERSADSLFARLNAGPCAGSSAVTGPAVMPTAPLAALLWRCRWPTGGTCTTSDAVGRTVARHRPCLREQPVQPDDATAVPPGPARKGNGLLDTARQGPYHYAIIIE